MAPAGQQLHARAKRRLVFNLRQDASSDRDNRIGRKHQAVRTEGRDGRSLFASKPKCMVAWNLAARDALVDVGGHDLVGHHANTREQIEPARACGS